MNKKYTPYNFDEEYEYKIYSRIGERDLKRFMDKEIRNDAKYPVFDKYLEWENYFKDKFVKNYDNVCNFWHYLNKRLRCYKREEELIKSLFIPLYLALITIILTIYSMMDIATGTLILTMLVGILLVLFICSYLFCISNNRVRFYKDCMKIIEKRRTNHCK